MAVLSAILARACLGSAVLARGDDLGAALALVRADEARRVQVLADAGRSVVCLFEDREHSSGGSGVLIDSEGYGLTNFHVVASFLDSRRGFGGLSDGQLYPLKVLGIDPGGDIAMFKLEGRDRFEHAELGNADELCTGQWVAALGNPFLLAEDYTPTVTLGVISGLHRYQFGQGNLLEYADCIQVSTSINPGNSGGPLFDLRGRVVGIVGRASFEERGRVNVGLGYAVTVNQVRRFLPALRAGRLCEHGTLGATTELAGDDLIFNAVQELSPAARAGIELGDVLIAINGRPVRAPNEYNNLIAVLPAEWPVTLSLRRHEQERIVHARLERLPLHDLPLFVPDLEQNHAEIRRAFGSYEQADRQAAGRPVARVSSALKLVGGKGESDAGVEIAFVHESDGRTKITQGGREMVGGPGESRWEFRGADGSNAEAWPEAPVWQEWAELVMPLLGAREIAVGWELRGGDEVEGRIVTVVERRLEGGRRVRWKFDLESHELAQGAIGDEQQPESVLWWPGARQPFGELCWPATWHRRTADGAEVELRIAALEAEIVASSTRPERQP